MKIGLVSAHAFLKEGGVKNHIIFLKKYLEKEGHSVKILLPEDFGKIFFLPANASEGTISFSSKKKIFFVLEKEKFDILHFHNFSLFFPYFVLKEAKKIKKKPALILTFHASLDASFFLKKSSPLIKIFEKKILPFFDGIIFTSETVASQIQTKIPSIIIPNGISLEKFSPEGEVIKKFPFKKFIFFVGRLEKRKGVFYLLKIFKLLKKDFPFLHLVIGGEGPLKRKLQKYALHLNQIHHWLALQPNILFEDIYFPGLIRNPKNELTKVWCALKPDVPIERVLPVIQPDLYRTKK